MWQPVGLFWIGRRDHRSQILSQPYNSFCWTVRSALDSEVASTL